MVICRSMFFELVGGTNGNHAVPSGSPISLRVRGVADSSASVVDVDDVQIRVQVSVYANGNHGLVEVLSVRVVLNFQGCPVSSK